MRLSAGKNKTPESNRKNRSPLGAEDTIMVVEPVASLISSQESLSYRSANPDMSRFQPETLRFFSSVDSLISVNSCHREIGRCGDDGWGRERCAAKTEQKKKRGIELLAFFLLNPQ